MHIANDQKLGRFNVSLPLCVLCSNNVSCFYQLTQMPAVENNGGTIVTPCLMVSSCACVSLARGPRHS